MNYYLDLKNKTSISPNGSLRKYPCFVCLSPQKDPNHWPFLNCRTSIGKYWGNSNQNILDKNRTGREIDASPSQTFCISSIQKIPDQAPRAKLPFLKFGGTNSKPSETEAGPYRGNVLIVRITGIVWAMDSTSGTGKRRKYWFVTRISYSKKNRLVRRFLMYNDNEESKKYA